MFVVSRKIQAVAELLAQVPGVDKQEAQVLDELTGAG